MIHGRFISALPLFGLAFLVTGCATDSLRSIQIIPAAGTQVLTTAGEHAQFKATGTYQRGSHPATTEDVTSMVTWTSSDTAVATIAASGGLATAGATQGTTVIAAGMNGSLGSVTGTSDLAVSGKPATGLVSLSMIPGSQTVATVGETGQFIAIGSFDNSAATTQDLTNIVAWKSGDVKVATVDASGLVTGVSPGTTTITAIGTASSGAVITATSNFTETSGPGTVNLPTLTVYKAGNGGGTVTAPAVNSSTTFAINCGSGLGCAGNFTLNSVVILTEVPQPGSTFGGWSANCTPINPVNPTQCKITMSNNDSVGAIFNANL